jgi:hypothetical protein
MRHNKIIFLDIDGVVNIPPYMSFDKKCLNNLQKIVNDTSAKIVVSSSWRDADNERMKDNFIEHKFTKQLWKEVIDITCRGYKNVIKGSNLPIVRGNEIKQWVDTQLIYPWHGNPEMDAAYKKFDEHGKFIMMNSNKVGENFTYVILDDDTDMLLEQKDWFIQTDPIKGLSLKDANKAIKLLNCIQK